MSADTVHGACERRLKKEGNVYDMSHFVETLAKASEKTHNAQPLGYQNFYRFENMTPKTKGAKFPKIADIKKIRFAKGKWTMSYATSLNGEWMEVNILKRGYQFPEIESLRHTAPRGMNSMKKNRIVKELLSMIPRERQVFWLDLPENNSSKCLLTREEESFDN